MRDLLKTMREWWHFWKDPSPQENGIAKAIETIHDAVEQPETTSAAKEPGVGKKVPVLEGGTNEGQKKELGRVERERMKDVLKQPVTLTNDMLNPVPEDWTRLQSVFFLAQCAALQREPVDDLI